MRILVTTERLAEWGGTETYVLTIADHLQQLGHEVSIATARAGRPVAWARSRGLRVLETDDRRPSRPDLIVSNTAPLALDVSSDEPSSPHVWVAHSTLSPLQVPPPADVAHRVVALNDRVRRWASAVAGVGEVVRLRQPIDVRRFAPRGPLGDRPRRILLLGNYLAGARRAMLEAVAGERGIEVVQVGLPDRQHDAVEDAIGGADIVVGYGRGILEAMACGRAAYVFDRNGGDGWVTPETYAELESDGFAGTATGVTITRERLEEDLQRYDPRMGTANRDLVMSGHKAQDHAAELLEVAAAIARPSRKPGGLEDRRELALAIRASASVVELVDGLNHHVEVLAQRIADLERERDTARAERDALAARLPTRDADAEWARSVRGSARFRLTQALLRPLDRARSWVQTR